MRRHGLLVLVVLVSALASPCCRKKKESAGPGTTASTEAPGDPGAVIKEFRDHFHDTNYLFQELLHEKDQEALQKPYRYVEIWYRRLGLLYGNIEDRLAFEHTKVYVEGEPQEVSDLMVFDLNCEVPHVERVYLQVPWRGEDGKIVRQEDAFHEVFSDLVENDRLPTVSRTLKIRMKQENGRWRIWEDIEGLILMAKGQDEYHKELEAVEVGAQWDEAEEGYVVRGRVRNKGNRSVLRVQLLIQFRDEDGRPVGNISEEHFFGEHALDPGYAAGFNVVVGGESDYDWYEAWNKEDVTVTILGAEALPEGIQLAKQPTPKDTTE